MSDNTQAAATAPDCCDACARSPRQRAAHARLVKARAAEQPPAEDDALSPTLRLLRDALLTRPGTTNAEALSGARQYLAAHARELAEAQHDAARTVGAYMRARSDRSRVAHCGGRHAVIADLRRYADDLDAAAVDGGQ